MTRKVLRARWLLPIEGPPIPGGYIAIDGDRIASVGAARPVGTVEDLGDVALLPGLVNAHTHLEFSGRSQPLGVAGTSLPDWIRLVIGDRKRAEGDTAAAISAGVRESLCCGVTTLGEIATAPPSLYPAGQPGPAVLQFQEAIGFSAGRIESVATEVERRLVAAPPPAGVSPHAPYTVHATLLERLVQLAAKRSAPVAMHLAESREELRLLDRGDGPFRDLLEDRSMWDATAIPRGTRPLDYLRRLSRAPRALVIHGNYLDEEEIEFLARNRETMSVVYCPRTHAFFGHDAYPLAAMCAAGVSMSLGTDSRASNPDLSLITEMRLLAALHPRLNPAEVLRMATLGGAEALGLSALVGSLAVGKRADLVAIACGPDCADPLAFIAASTSMPLRVWVQGRELTALEDAPQDAS